MGCVQEVRSQLKGTVGAEVGGKGHLNYLRDP